MKKINPIDRFQQYFSTDDFTFIFDDEDIPEFQDPSDLTGR